MGIIIFPLNIFLSPRSNYSYLSLFYFQLNILSKWNTLWYHFFSYWWDFFSLLMKNFTYQLHAVQKTFWKKIMFCWPVHALPFCTYALLLREWHFGNVVLSLLMLCERWNSVPPNEPSSTWVLNNNSLNSLCTGINGNMCFKVMEKARTSECDHLNKINTKNP